MKRSNPRNEVELFWGLIHLPASRTPKRRGPAPFIMPPFVMWARMATSITLPRPPPPIHTGH